MFIYLLDSGLILGNKLVFKGRILYFQLCSLVVLFYIEVLGGMFLENCKIEWSSASFGSIFPNESTSEPFQNEVKTKGSGFSGNN